LICVIWSIGATHHATKGISPRLQSGMAAYTRQNHVRVILSRLPRDELPRLKSWAACEFVSGPYHARHSSITWRLMLGKNLLRVAKQHGHSVEVMLRMYAASIEGATDADIQAIKQAMVAEGVGLLAAGDGRSSSASLRSGRGRACARRPPTPPYVRFRIRRFMIETESAGLGRPAKPTFERQSRTLERPDSSCWRRYSTRGRAR
jgi:hypothetical protein